MQKAPAGHTFNSVASCIDYAFHFTVRNVSAKLILDPQSKSKAQELDLALCALMHLQTHQQTPSFFDLM